MVLARVGILAVIVALLFTVSWRGHRFVGAQVVNPPTTGIMGPASAPSGACPSTPGMWVLSQDGHESYCPISGTGVWVTKI
jgi:hypothetical protein